MDLWNTKQLSPPPTNSYKVIENNIDLIKLRNALEHGINHFKDQGIIIREAAVLSRIIYRLKTKLRTWKYFKSLEKVKHALNIYFNTNLTSYLYNVVELIPAKYEKDTYLPTKNMLHFILVRIQGLAKLMERIYDTCKIAAYQINKIMYLGHFWKIKFILFAVISRIFVIIKFNTKYLCEIYGKLYPLAQKLHNNGKKWLPENYILPSDLREWLGVSWVYEEDYVDLTVKPDMNDVFDLLNSLDDGDDDVEFCDEYVLINEDNDEDIEIVEHSIVKQAMKKIGSSNRMRGFSINEDDIGEEIMEVINLENDAKGGKNKAKKNKNKNKIIIDIDKNMNANKQKFDLTKQPHKFFNDDKANALANIRSNEVIDLVNTPKKENKFSLQERVSFANIKIPNNITTKQEKIPGVKPPINNAKDSQWLSGPSNVKEEKVKDKCSVSNDSVILIEDDKKLSKRQLKKKKYMEKLKANKKFKYDDGFGDMSNGKKGKKKKKFARSSMFRE